MTACPTTEKVVDDNSGMEFSVFAGGTQADSDGPAREVALDLGNNIITLDEEQTAVGATPRSRSTKPGSRT